MIIKLLSFTCKVASTPSHTNTQLVHSFLCIKLNLYQRRHKSFPLEIHRRHHNNLTNFIIRPHIVTMPPKSSISKADADLQLVIGVIHQLLPNGNASGKVDFANLAAYLDSGKPHSARMRWNRFIQRVDWGTGTMIDTAAAVTGEVGNNAGESSNPKKELKDKKEKKGGKAGVKRVRDNKG